MTASELPTIDDEPLSLQRVTRADGTRCVVLHAGAGHVGLEGGHAKRLAYELNRAASWTIGSNR